MKATCSHQGCTVLISPHLTHCKKHSGSRLPLPARQAVTPKRTNKQKRRKV